MVILTVVILIFLLTQLFGDPVRIMLPPSAPETAREGLREFLGLNDPFGTRFYRFMLDYVTLDFGISFWQRSPNLALITEALPITLFLGACSVTLAIVLGGILGVMAGIMPNTPVDYVVRVISFLSISIPYFWVALMLVVIFAVFLRWLPTSGFALDAKHVVLPLITLSLRAVGRMANIMRSSVIEIMRMQYIVTARSKGISEARVVLNHVLKNSFPTMLVMAIYDLGRMFAGHALVTEVIFQWPGLARLTYQSLTHRDLPLVGACAFFLAVIVGVLNLAVDISIAFLNPRIVYSNS